MISEDEQCVYQIKGKNPRRCMSKAVKHGYCNSCLKKATVRSELGKTVPESSSPTKGIDPESPESEATDLMPLFNIARSKGIVGIDAFNHIGYFLTLKLIEQIQILENEEYRLDPENSPFPDIVKSVLEQKLHYWSNLMRAPEEHLIVKVKEVFFSLRSNDILEKHFPHPNTLKLEGTSEAVHQIMNIIDKVNVSGENFGDIYENMLGRQMIGKDLGQFFTPYWVRKYVVNLINPRRREDGTIPTICDPAAGTAGFISSAVRHLKKQGEIRDVENSIFGVEINHDTFRGGLSHLMITTKKHIPGFVLGDSLRNPPDRQFDYIFSNPPFGLKGIKWESCPNIPIKDNNGNSLFLQRLIQLLKVGGTAGIIFPVGKEINNSEFQELRALLLKCCRLDSVIKLPKKTFEHTSCSTCVLVFTKVYEANQILSSTMKGKQQINTWSAEGATREVRFYEIDKVPVANAEPVVKELLVVNIEQIAAKNWSLRVEEYQDAGSVVRSMKNDWPVFPLGQLCTFKNGKAITKEDFIDGEYPVVGGGQKPVGYHNIYNVPADTIIISKDGAYAGFVSRYDTPIFVSGHGIYIDTIDPSVSPGYLYLLLKYSFQKTLYDLGEGRGSTRNSINKSQLEELLVSLPSLDKQLEVVQLANELQTRIDRLTLEVKDSKLDYKKLDRYMIGPEFPLEQLCTMESGKMTANSMDNVGTVPFYNCSAKCPIGTHSETSFDYPEYVLFIKDGGSANNQLGEKVGLGKVYFAHGPSACTNGVICIRSKREDVSIRYLYWVLFNKRPEISGMAKYDRNLGHMNMDRFKAMLISVPSLEKQLEMIERGNRIERHIKLTEELIADLKLELASVVDDNL
ncbi:MAG: N-6 DNA methylase [Nitrososphaerales archaeon]